MCHMVYLLFGDPMIKQVLHIFFNCKLPVRIFCLAAVCVDHDIFVSDFFDDLKVIRQIALIRSAAHVLGVVTFYPGLRQMCPGKNHIRVCRTLSCAMAGADSLFDAICTRLGIDKNGIDHHHPIGVSPDGLWSVEGVECLANCGFGPNMMVNDLLYEKVTPEVLEEVIAKYQTA